MRLIGSKTLSLGMVALLGWGLVPSASAAPSPPPNTVAKGNDWRIEPVAGGYRITLELDRRVPLRDALPMLSVDGRAIGVAKESADRRSVSLISKDPAVLRAKNVTLLWSGDPSRKRSKAAAGPTDADWLKAKMGPALPDDPGAKGKYAVDTAEYNLGDEAIYLPGLKQKSELRGKVYSPRGATGPRPLVVFLHGRHQVCYGGDENGPYPEKPWPCTGAWKSIPSYRGYDGPAEALASHGYQVVSISANAINAWDSEAYDAGAQARAELVLDHLDLWKKWSTVGGGPFGTRFVGKVDLRNVGLMGHSRGGEGVARAAVLNADRGGKYGIRAVLPLAPTDFARATVPGIAMSVVLPYCDGDVSDLQGQKFYDDTRYSVTGDNAPRSTVTVLGANHNFFNTEWTPGQSEAPSNDDWYEEGAESPCGPKYAGRLNAKEQQAVGTAYVAGFFRLQLGHEKQLLPLLDGSNGKAASTGKAVVRVVAQAPAADRRDLSRLDQALPAGAVSGKAKATVCSSDCVQTEDPTQTPHWISAWFAAQTPTLSVTKLSWTGKDGVLRVPVAAGQRDVRQYAALTFRAAPDAAGAPRTDLSIRVVDGHGRAASVPASTLGDALVRMPGSGDVTPKNLLRAVRVPIASLKGIDLSDVRAVELRTDRVASGSVFVSDLSFSRPGVGTSAPAVLLPKLSASSVKVQEGDTGTKNVDFFVTLSRPSIRPVTVYAETNGDLGSSVGQVNRKLVFNPGQTRQKITVPITGNTRDSADLAFSLVLSAPHDGLLDEPFGHGVVIDDDPTPTLKIGTATAKENAKLLEFPITLSAASDQYVSVEGELKDGTAVLGKDFKVLDEEPPSRSFYGYVEPGQTKGVIQVRLVDDKVKEPAETFSASFAEVMGADLEVPASVTGTITDDD